MANCMVSFYNYQYFMGTGRKELYFLFFGHKVLSIAEKINNVTTDTIKTSVSLFFCDLSKTKSSTLKFPHTIMLLSL